MARQLIAHGIDTVYATDDARLGHFQTGSYARVLSTLIEKHRPQIVMYGATAMGRDLAPRVASTIQAGMTADCTELDISDVTDPEDQAVAPEPAAANPPRLWRKHHRHDRQLRPLAADGHGPRGRDGDARARPEPHGQDRARGGRTGRDRAGPETHRAAHRAPQAEPQGRPGHRGRRRRDRQQGELQADLRPGRRDRRRRGASRAAVDGGYIGKEHQIGQTGTTVRPALYIAVAISGAVQHRAGMEESAKIIAVNIDRNAPIFSVAHYGIVGDYKQVLPMMIKSLRERA